MNKQLMRWMGAYFLLDGLLTLSFGRKYVRPFRFGRRTSPYRRMIEWLLDLPAWQLRGAGAAEAALGLAVLSRAPLDVPGLYRLVAAGYAAIDPGWRQWFYPQAHQAFDRALSNGFTQDGDVLDLGCGVGANLARIRAMGLPLGSYTGVDLSTAMLRHAKERYGNIPHVSFQPLDLMSAPLPEGPYDLVLSTWVFEHLPDLAEGKVLLPDDHRLSHHSCCWAGDLLSRTGLEVVSANLQRSVADRARPILFGIATVPFGFFCGATKMRG